MTVRNPRQTSHAAFENATDILRRSATDHRSRFSGLPRPATPIVEAARSSCPLGGVAADIADGRVD